MSNTNRTVYMNACLGCMNLVMCGKVHGKVLVKCLWERLNSGAVMRLERVINREFTKPGKCEYYEKMRVAGDITWKEYIEELRTNFL